MLSTFWINFFCNDSLTNCKSFYIVYHTQTNQQTLPLPLIYYTISLYTILRMNMKNKYVTECRNVNKVARWRRFRPWQITRGKWPIPPIELIIWTKWRQALFKVVLNEKILYNDYAKTSNYNTKTKQKWREDENRTINKRNERYILYTIRIWQSIDK